MSMWYKVVSPSNDQQPYFKYTKLLISIFLEWFTAQRYYLYITQHNVNVNVYFINVITVEFLSIS